MEGKRKAVATEGSRPKKGSGKQKLHRAEFPDEEGTPLFDTLDEAALYAKLKFRGIKSTKFYHEPTMKGLGIHKGVTALFKNIKWDGFLKLEAKTYAVPTREFLATFMRNDAERKLTFRLRSQKYMVSYDALNALMHTPTEGCTKAKDPVLDECPFDDFWKEITVLNAFRSGHDPDLWIIHPCWRIAHRMLSTCLLAKSDPSQVIIPELTFMYQLATKKPRIPDFATYFLEKCEQVTYDESTEICIGGFITIIGESLGFKFHEKEVDKYHLLDWGALLRMYLIGHGDNYERGSYNWLYRSKHPIYKLPNPNISAFIRFNKETWKPQIEFVLPPTLSHPDIDTPPAEEEGHHSGGQHLPPISVLTHRMGELLRERLDPQISYLHDRVDGVVDMIRAIPTRSDWDHRTLHGSFPPVLPHEHVARHQNLPESRYVRPPSNPYSYQPPTGGFPQYPQYQPPPGGYPPYQPPPGGYPPYQPPPGGPQ